jgi:hypothetical protein
LRVLAAQRSPDSYIAGGVAINREGPRFSGDIDIFHDSQARLEAAANTDAAALTAAGYVLHGSECATANAMPQYRAAARRYPANG